MIYDLTENVAGISFRLSLSEHTNPPFIQIILRTNLEQGKEDKVRPPTRISQSQPLLTPPELPPQSLVHVLPPQHLLNHCILKPILNDHLHYSLLAKSKKPCFKKRSRVTLATNLQHIKRTRIPPVARTTPPFQNTTRLWNCQIVLFEKRLSHTIPW